MSMHDFSPIISLSPMSDAVRTIGVDWNDSTQPLVFDINWAEGSSKLTLKVPVGELIRAVTMPHWMFMSEQGKFSLEYLVIYHLFLVSLIKFELIILENSFL